MLIVAIVKFGLIVLVAQTIIVEHQNRNTDAYQWHLERIEQMEINDNEGY